MADLIDMGKLMDQFLNHYAVRDPKQNAIMDEVRMMLIQAPTVDAVPVVRCKDCNFYGRNKRCVMNGLYITGSDFCSYGERKEDA